jgi:hypothetical protein
MKILITITGGLKKMPACASGLPGRLSCHRDRWPIQFGNDGLPLELKWRTNRPTLTRASVSPQLRFIYHSGLDIGGAEGLVDVLAATSGAVVGLGTAVVDKEKDNASLDRNFNDTIWVQDERGWYHRYTHLYSFDPSVKLGGRVVMGQKIGTLGKEAGAAAGHTSITRSSAGRSLANWGLRKDMPSSGKPTCGSTSRP